jgi:chitodextrinase
MLDGLTSGHRSAPTALPANTPDRLVINDVSDSAVALAWSPVSGAQTYTVYRAAGGNQSFAAIGTVTGLSFDDAGLRPQTNYAYKVTATTGGSEGPASQVMTATTLPVPPRCPAPGKCPVSR